MRSVMYLAFLVRVGLAAIIATIAGTHDLVTQPVAATSGLPATPLELSPANAKPDEAGSADQSGGLVDPARILTAAESLKLQADFYAEDFDVSIEEAERRLMLAPAITDLNSYLQQNFPDHFGSLRADNGQPFRVIVQMTTGGEEPVYRYVAGRLLDGIVEVETVERNHAGMQKLYLEVMEMLAPIDIPFSSGHRGQSVILYVVDAEELQAQLVELHIQLPLEVVIERVGSMPTPDVGTGNDSPQLPPDSAADA